MTDPSQTHATKLTGVDSEANGLSPLGFTLDSSFSGSTTSTFKYNLETEMFTSHQRRLDDESSLKLSANSCIDSPLRFRTEALDGVSTIRDFCDWVGEDITRVQVHCNLDGIKEYCPITCETCQTMQCKDSSLLLRYKNAANKSSFN